MAGSFQANLVQKVEATYMNNVMEFVKTLPKPYQAIFGAVMEFAQAGQALIAKSFQGGQAARAS